MLIRMIHDREGRGRAGVLGVEVGNRNQSVIVNRILSKILGTPNEDTWPGVTSLADFKSAFPKWPSKDLATVVPNLDSAGIDLLSLFKEDPYEYMPSIASSLCDTKMKEVIDSVGASNAEDFSHLEQRIDEGKASGSLRRHLGECRSWHTGVNLLP
ncbi:hypothetical protein LOK49_LG11G01521 [Camellia lanceoleosa]|uniref:Uncharacterized protein n=1 Tax=Camellia lanceoleosa TaxID=1840588 RepID=A0ACC0G2Q0_9ERIC|nr:hypothetical protein LOK49_LG11G01521 [Camellia lanceoleosa]